MDQLEGKALLAFAQSRCNAVESRFASESNTKEPVDCIIPRNIDTIRTAVRKVEFWESSGFYGVIVQCSYHNAFTLQFQQHPNSPTD